MMRGLHRIGCALLFLAMLVATAGQAFAAAPSVSSISPLPPSSTSGTGAGGSTVIILGSGFTGATSVTFGGNPASFTVNSDNQITATTPVASPSVTPSVTSISPNHGGTGGGTLVGITGSGFTSPVDVVVTTPGGNSGSSGAGLYTYIANALSIGGTNATSFSVSNANSIIAFTPPGIPGVADVIVVDGNANSGASGAKLYTYTDGGPNVSTVGPDIGLTAGGNQITITGSNFVPGTKRDGTTATTVTVGGNPATNVVVNSTVSLTANVPAGSAGAQTVAVSTVAGTGTSTYLYVAPTNPIVSTISPNGTTIANGGTTAGGTQVTITGANFVGVTSVTIGGVPVSSFNVVNPGQITTVTPPHAAGAVDVVVTVVVPNGGGTFTGTGTGLFTYVTPGPTLTSISPSIGVTTGGTAVTITGLNFTGATLVTIGGTPLTTFKVVSDTQISGTTAPHAAGTNLPVAVTTPNGTGTGTTLSTEYTYGTPPPTVTSVTPPTGGIAGGNLVTITGVNFTGATAVTFGGFPATSVTVVSDTQITAVTPAHSAGAVNVSVTTPAGTGTGSGVYTYSAAPPTVTAIFPASGITQGGTLVTITGTGFSGTPQVTINGVTAGQVTLVDANHLTAVTPAGTGTNVPVVVITSFGASTPANLYSYVQSPPPVVAAPTVTAISPNTGGTVGGTHVTITGTNFTGATAVTIGGNAATGVAVVSATSIIATTPPGTLGAADVVVTTPGGIGTGPGLFTYVNLLPTVTAILPSSGTTLGGTTVTITGTNFTGATSVTIGGAAATGLIVLSPTSIAAKTPNHSAGPASVVVTTPAGSSTGGPTYTYVAPTSPTVTAITPNHGTTLGGTSVTITGTNFTGTTSVKIGGAGAQFITVVSATTITATTPPGAAGPADVVVTTPAGSGTGTGLFTYFVMPTVTGIFPPSGPAAGGTIVAITGTGFTGATAVNFGGTAATAFTVISSTTITATSPAGTGTVDVTVTTPFATSLPGSADKFTYAAAPVVGSVTPNAGPVAGGTVVTITGTGFTGATSVKFGATAATFTVVSATTITATSPPGSGTVNVTVTTPGGTSANTSGDQFSYNKAATTLTLTSSPNPSTVGQPVTFTARVTGNSPTGTVIFTENGATIGSAPLVGGVATFTISSLPAGSNAVTASYGGDANNAADPETVIQVVNAKTDSANLRQMQLATMPIVTNLSGQAISGAIDNAIGSGFSDCQLLMPNGSGFTYCFGGDARAQTSLMPGQGGLALNEQERLEKDFAALGYAGPPNTKAPPAPPPLPRDWLAWIDLRGADFDRTSSGNDVKGTQVNAIAGLTRKVTRDFVVGVLGGYEHFDFSSQAYNGVLRGDGWTAGAYMGWRLAPSLRFTASGAWSDIGASDTSGTASGTFGGHRWLASAGLTGTYGSPVLLFEPSAQVYALWEQENAYTDSLGTLQAGHNFDTGRASAGLKLSHLIPAGPGALAPYLGIYGDYYFSKDDASIPAGLTSVPLLQGGGARATGGLTAIFGGGAQLSVGGEFSGLAHDTYIWNLQVRGAVPF